MKLIDKKIGYYTNSPFDLNTFVMRYIEFIILFGLLLFGIELITTFTTML